MAAPPMAAEGGGGGTGTERGRPATSAPSPGRRLGLLPPAVNGAEGREDGAEVEGLRALPLPP